MKILIIEDDKNIADLVSVHLRDLPAEIKVIPQGWIGLDEALTGQYDFLILDLMLPGLNGLEICRQIRQKKILLPILMLTARSEDVDKIKGLETGADDYLTKPFSPGEMVARVRSIMRRTQRESRHLAQSLQLIERNGLRIDLVHRVVHRGVEEIDLTAKEFDLLKLFMQNPGRPYSRIEILDEIWGEQFDGLEHTVNSHINRLRSKIEPDIAHPVYILTAWGIGYKFNNDL